MANVDVTIAIIDAHADLITLALTTPDPPSMPSARWNLVDRVTGTTIPVQGITLP